jgi:phage baseplate assembly protein W
MRETLGTGLAFPLGVDSRRQIAVVSGATDVEQAIGIILDTAPGERPMRPDFGCAIHDLVFDSLNAETMRRVEDSIRAALDRWEPRIVVEDVEFDIPEPTVLRISVRYRIKATNDRRNLVYPFYVIPTEEER